ncbi:MAG: pyridoxal phosphate-dependent decarboxylase family protein [Candidatus Hodarchaeales archaeon]|jgi:glutamate/tyrosine decarboxylase-like PLP-dependent enzyme
MTDEETLDPLDWNEFRVLGHQMVDDMLNFLETIRDRPVWQPIPQDIKNFFKKPIPKDPEAARDIYQDFLEKILPYPLGNIHPRFWGWVCGTGTPFGMLAELLTAGMNVNQAGGYQIANYVETQVLDWFKEIMGFSPTASGLLTSGCSMANLIGLTVARNAKAGFDVREEGLQAISKKMIAYGSEEMHSSLQKAVELLGLGNSALRKIEVNEDFQISIDSLKSQIEEDKEKGYQPFCIIGNAGTINTGAFDDLQALATISKQENLWFHVDGAFGAWVKLSPNLSSLVTGIEKADSLAFDLHKWLYMPYEAGCVLVQQENYHRQSFSMSIDYLDHSIGGIAAGEPWFSEYGVQLSRKFRALKVWMEIRQHGLQKYARLIQQNVDQAHYLASVIQSTPNLELLAPCPSNVVCFRFKPSSWNEEPINKLNREILVKLHEEGVAAPSNTMIGNKFALRAAIANHRSKRDDFDLLIDSVVSLGKKLVLKYE